MIKLGIIGLGRIFTYQIQSLKLNSNYLVNSLFDKDKFKYESYSEYDCYNNIGDFLASDIDTVMISVPVKYHYQLAKQALENDLNVILEKPACNDMSELNKLVSLSQKKEKHLYISVHAAFGREVLWFKKMMNDELFKSLGPITFIQGNFYDPYIQNGMIKDEYVNLGGSWSDSGINGLSVIEKLINIDNVVYDRSYLTHFEDFKVSEIQGEAFFRYNYHDHFCIIHINTNWALEKNLKKTYIFFHETSTEVLLHHSNESIFLNKPGESPHLIKDLSNQNTRLVNHYIGLFDDHYKCIMNNKSNLNSMLKIHELYFKVFNAIS